MVITKKQRIRICVVFVFMLLGLAVFWCLKFKHKETVTPKTQVLGGYYFGLQNPKECEFIYNGDAIKIPYYVQAATEIYSECGIMVFLDGVVQKVNAGGENPYMYVVEVQDNQRKNFDLEFYPSFGKKGDCLELYILAIFNPSYRVEDSEGDYGMYHAASSDKRMSLNFGETVNDVEQKRGKTDIKYSEKKQNGEPQYSLESVSGEQLCIDQSLVLKLFPEENVDYCSTVFINHKPVMINNYSNMYMEYRNSSYEEVVFHLESEDELKGINVIYAIAIPLHSDSENVTVVKTKSKLLRGR